MHEYVRLDISFNFSLKYTAIYIVAAHIRLSHSLSSNVISCVLSVIEL